MSCHRLWHVSSELNERRCGLAGAGTGFVSICAALLGAKAVAVTDGSAEVLELAKANAEANLSREQLARLTFSPLRWEASAGKLFESVTNGKGFDIILASDVTYDQSVIPILVAALRALSARHTCILLSHTQRPRISLQQLYDAFAVETVSAIPQSVATCRENFLETYVLKMAPLRPVDTSASAGG